MSLRSSISGRTQAVLGIVRVPAVLLVATVSSSLLVACGYGPYGLCRTPCVEPNYVRDSACECWPKDPKAGGSIQLPPEAELGPYINWRWEENECTGINRYKYIENPSKRSFNVVVNMARPDGSRMNFTKFVPGRTTNHPVIVDLGLEEEPPDCKDKDFVIVSVTAANNNRTSALTALLEDIADRRSALAEERHQPWLVAQGGGVSDLGQKTGMDCSTECSEANPTSFCMPVRPHKAHADALQEIIKKIRAPAAVAIKAQEYRSLFGVTVDPCGRGDISLKDGRFTNSGDECFLDVALMESGTADLSVKIRIPKLVDGQVEHQQSGTTISLIDMARSPTLKWSLKQADRLFGGRVDQILLTSSSMLLRSPNTCYKVDLGP